MIPFSEHLDECCDTEPNFQMFPFFKINFEHASAKFNKETHFMKRFKPKLNVLKWYNAHGYISATLRYDVGKPNNVTR